MYIIREDFKNMVITSVDGPSVDLRKNPSQKVLGYLYTKGHPAIYKKKGRPTKKKEIKEEIIIDDSDTFYHSSQRKCEDC